MLYLILGKNELNFKVSFAKSFLKEKYKYANKTNKPYNIPRI